MNSVQLILTIMWLKAWRTKNVNKHIHMSPWHIRQLFYLVVYNLVTAQWFLATKRYNKHKIQLNISKRHESFSHPKWNVQSKSLDFHMIAARNARMKLTCLRGHVEASQTSKFSFMLIFKALNLHWSIYSSFQKSKKKIGLTANS